MDLCLVSYASFEKAIGMLQKVGCAALIAKADIKSAFRLLPIHPDSFNSLGFHFYGQFYFDRCLPMGCSLSSFYFESFSSFLEWVVTTSEQCDSVLHYLDDFLFLGPAGTDQCASLLNAFFRICQHFGVPLALDKTVSPTTFLEFLGITIDTVSMEFRLPVDKIKQIVS